MRESVREKERVREREKAYECVVLSVGVCERVNMKRKQQEGNNKRIGARWRGVGARRYIFK